MQIIYQDEKLLVCVKPAGVLSTDEPGGVPELIRNALEDPQANVRTVHRLDRVVGGLMVLARTARAASDLSAQIRDGSFKKEYLAVIHGCPEETEGTLGDLLFRNKEERKTYIVTQPGKDVQEAILHYRVIAKAEGLSLVRIALETGRTHQIRAQFSSRGMALVGDKKYGLGEDCPIALWSCGLKFIHPAKGEELSFSLEPPAIYPWTEF